MADRVLETEKVEGEISLVIDYEPGRTVAVDVLRGAMALIESLDHLDKVLLSSVDTSLEPVSVLNDVRHSSLKMLLARALRALPDNHLATLEWKHWVGELLVKGKYRLLQVIDADAPEIQRVLLSLEAEYTKSPAGLLGFGYSPPSVTDVQPVLEEVSRARAEMSGHRVTIQTELGDIELPDVVAVVGGPFVGVPVRSVTNSGTEFFKVKAADLLGNAQWTILRNSKQVRVDMLHQAWLDAYHQRKIPVLPGDSLECRFEETTSYDEANNEVERRLAIIEVLRVISPPSQQRLV